MSHLEEFTENQKLKIKKKPVETIKQADPYVKKARALGVNAARPPNNARLNLYNLLFVEEKKGPEDFSYHETTARLICLLYQEEPFFQPGIEYKLLGALRAKHESIAFFEDVDQLLSLDFEDEFLQTAFFHMLKGTKTAPSLLNYVTLDKINDKAQARKINVLFADPLIIQAIFPNNNVAEKLIARRDAIWTDIEYQELHRLESTKEECKGRKDYGVEIKQGVEQALIEGGIDPKLYVSKVFDCTLGKPGSVIFLEDPRTGALLRQKYVPPRKKETAAN
jgi:hypothetical protein